MNAIRQLIALCDYQIKFVVENAKDIQEIDALLQRLGAVEPGNVLLMAQARSVAELDDREPEIADICRDRGFRFCPRLHIRLFGNGRGT